MVHDYAMVYFRKLTYIYFETVKFAQALRVISHVHEDENPKQLLFYEMDGVRRGF